MSRAISGISSTCIQTQTGGESHIWRMLISRLVFWYAAIHTHRCSWLFGRMLIEPVLIYRNAIYCYGTIGVTKFPVTV
jgi:hypothetical protein